MTIYTLSIGTNGVTLSNKDYQSITIGKDINQSEGDWYVTVLSMQYEKAVFTPGHMQVKLQFTTANGAQLPNVQNLKKFFIGKEVNLIGKADRHNATIIDKDGKKTHIMEQATLAEKYFVFGLTPRYESTSTTSLYVTLHIYSPDKYLTLKKYCNAYVSKKLGADIFQTDVPTCIQKENANIEIGEGSKENSGEGTEASKTKIALDYAHLNHLTLQKNNASEEFIQPYLVQYNESFYNFLARTANRCGEFLFYEKGVLHLGLDAQEASQNSKEIERYQSLTFNEFAEESENEYGHRHYYTDYETENGSYVGLYKGNKDDLEKVRSGNIDGHEKDITLIETPTYATKPRYELDGPADEFMEPIQKREGSELWEDEIYWFWPTFIDSLTSALSESTLTDMITAFGIDMGKKVATAKIKATNLNDKYNKKYFDGADESNLSADKASVSQFSNYRALLKFNKYFYADIRQKGIEAEKGAIHLCLGTNFRTLLLGGFISVNGQTYIVTQIKASTAVSSDKRTWEETMEVDAIPMIDNVPYPAPLLENHVRKSGSQVAFVIDNDDPLRMGRVRIRYPWQPVEATEETGEKVLIPTDKEADFLKGEEEEEEKKEDNSLLKTASPWIRMATPMASDGCGMKFVPQNGDEVLINYENGNIERPYVVGALYSPNNMPPEGSTTTHLIASPNGHTIKFCDFEDGTQFLTSLNPGLSMLRSFLPGLIKFPFMPKEWAGGIEMYDNFGMYSLSMSSSGRSVSIASPLGKVNIDAFTGISISAPNGKVSIEGKDISIVAGNSLTLKSGQNIDNGMLKMPSGSDLLNTAVGTAVSETVAKFLDFSFIRTIYETFLRPIGGEMLIKSYRYMRIEAGKGKAKVPNSYWEESGLLGGKKKTEKADNEEFEEFQETNLILIASMACWDTIASIYDRHIFGIRSRGELYKIRYDRYNAELDLANKTYTQLDSILQAAIDHPDQPFDEQQWNEGGNKIYDPEHDLKEDSPELQINENEPQMQKMFKELKLKVIRKHIAQRRIFDSLKADAAEVYAAAAAARQACDERIIDNEDLQQRCADFFTNKVMPQLKNLMTGTTNRDTVFSIVEGRKFVHATIESLVQAGKLAHKEKAATDADTVSASLNAWNNYIDSLKYPEDSLGVQLWDTVKDALGVDNFTKIQDPRFWKSTENHGEILLSDKSGNYTLRFSDNLQGFNNSSNTLLNEAKKALKDF